MKIYYQTEGRRASGDKFHSDGCSSNNATFRKLLHILLDEYLNEIQNQTPEDLHEGDLRFQIMPCFFHKDEE